MSDTTPATDVQNGEAAPPKTAKQLEKEAKKAAKLAKLQEKLDKKSTVAEQPKEVCVTIRRINANFASFIGF